MHEELLNIAAPTFGAYARRHRMDCVLWSGERLCPERPPAWDKLVWISALLPLYEGVLWIDADAIIVDGRPDIRRELSSCSVHIVTHSYNGLHVLNTGVMALRRTAKAQSFLEAIWEQVEFVEHPWWENAAAMKLLGYDPDKGLEYYGPTEWSPHVGSLSRRWNSVEPDPDPQPIIRHYAGVPFARRRVSMLADQHAFPENH